MSINDFPMTFHDPATLKSMTFHDLHITVVLPIEKRNQFVTRKEAKTFCSYKL